MATFIQTGQKVKNQINVMDNEVTLKQIAESIGVEHAQLIFKDSVKMEVTTPHGVYMILPKGKFVEIDKENT